jgi:hypothetical protein
MIWPDIIAGGSAETKASVALATECSGSVCYRDTNGWCTWVVVGNGCAARKVEATGSGGVGNTRVLRRKG